MIKYFSIILLAFLIAGCTKSTKIEFTGTAPRINDGTFTIRDVNDTLICQTNIKAEKFSISHEWPEPGYYYMKITKPGIGTLSFDVYLEAGKYTVITNPEKLYKYPDIESTSKIQNELTAYYHLTDAVNDTLHKKAADLSAQLKALQSKSLPAINYKDLENKLQDAQQQALKSAIIALSTFVDKYPDNEIATRLMLLNNAYQTDPPAYDKIYQKLSPDAKNSTMGVQLHNYLTNALNGK